MRPPQLVAAIAALVLILFWLSARSLVPIWDADTYRTYAHGWLVLAVGVWLLVRERRALASAALEPFPAAWLAVGASILVWASGWFLGFQVVHQAALPLILLTAIWAALGEQVARACLFPIAYLYFAIPIWRVDGPLIWLCVKVETGLLWVSGIPAQVSGNLIRIPEGLFAVESGCDGLHFLLVATALAALLGHLNRDPVRARLKLIALAAGIAVAANTIRIHSIFLIGHFTGMQSPLVLDHYAFGYAIFAAAMVTFFWFYTRLPIEGPAAQQSS